MTNSLKYWKSLDPKVSMMPVLSLRRKRSNILNNVVIEDLEAAPSRNYSLTLRLVSSKSFRVCWPSILVSGNQPLNALNIRYLTRFALSNLSSLLQHRSSLIITTEVFLTTSSINLLDIRYKISNPCSLMKSEKSRSKTKVDKLEYDYWRSKKMLIWIYAVLFPLSWIFL